MNYKLLGETWTPGQANPVNALLAANWA
jgi:hypothetical protein